MYDCTYNIIENYSYLLFICKVIYKGVMEKKNVFSGSKIHLKIFILLANEKFYDFFYERKALKESVQKDIKSKYS